MSTEESTEGYLYCRVALVDGFHAIQSRIMDEEEANQANLDLFIGEAEWHPVTSARDEYFDAFLAEWLTPFAADALARVVGGVGEPIETLAALESRYFPLFHAMVRSAYTIGRQVRADIAA